MEGSNYGWANGYKGKKLKHSQKVINSKKNTTKNSFSNAMKGKKVKEAVTVLRTGGTNHDLEVALYNVLETMDVKTIQDAKVVAERAAVLFNKNLDEDLLSIAGEKPCTVENVQKWKDDRGNVGYKLIFNNIAYREKYWGTNGKEGRGKRYKQLERPSSWGTEVYILWLNKADNPEEDIISGAPDWVKSHSKYHNMQEDCVAGDFGGMAPANVHSITTYGHTSKTVTGKRRNKRMKKTNDPVKEEVLSTINSAIKQGVVTESQIKNLFEEDEDEKMTIGEISSEDLTNDLFDTLSDWVIECAEENGISDEDLDLDNLYDDVGMFVDNYIEENEDKTYESESDVEEELYEYFKDKYDPEDYFPEDWDDEED